MSLTLSATNTLSAKAGTASAITYTLLGDAVVAGADSFQSLGQGQLAATATSIYPATAGTQTIIREIQLANTTGSDVLNVIFYMNGTGAANQINAGFTVPANGSASYRDGLFTIYSSTGLPITTSSITFTGDVTGSGTGTIATTLATVNSNVGSFGNASTVPTVTLNGKGLVTAANNTSILIVESQVTSLVSDLAGKQATGNYITALTGDMTATGPGSVAATLVNIPNDTTQAGDLLATAIVAPATPAAGKARTYVDSTSKNIAVKNDAGIINHGVQTRTATTSNWIRSIADDGSVTISQPAAADVAGLAASATTDTTNATNITSGALPVGRLPAFTGDVTETAGTGVTKVVAINNQAVSTTPATNGQVLQYVSASSQYIPESYAGDVSGGPSASNVVAIQNKAVSSTAPTTSQILQYTSGNVWTPTTREFNVVSYGADPTGTTNSATAIQNAVNAAQTAAYSGGSGAIVWFPPGRYLIGSTITVTGNNITLMGAGGGTSTDFGNYSIPMASHLVPQSAIKAIVVSPVLTNGLSGAPNYGFKLKGLSVDNYANAGTYGLQVISCANFDIDDYYAINSTSVGLDFNTLPATLTNGTNAFPLSAATVTVLNTAASGSGTAFPSTGSFILKDGTGAQRVVTYTGTTGTTFTGCSSAGLGTGTTPTSSTVSILPGAQDCTRGRVGQASFRQVDSGGASGIAIQLNGDTSGIANSNLINFVGPVKITHNTGTAIKDINSDSNYYDVVIINRAPGGTGIGADIGAGTTAALASRNNVFNHVSFGAGGLTLRGTPTATFPSGPTYVKAYQLANGEAPAVIEAGAYGDIQYNGAVMLPGLKNVSNVSTPYTIAALTLVPGSLIGIPQQGIQVGTTFRWHMPINKTTAAGTGGRVISIRIGPLGTTADPIVQTWTAGTSTGAIDSGYYDINYTITAIGASATGTAVMQLVHALAITGLDNTAGGNPIRIGTPSTFNSASATSLFVSLSMTTGTGEVSNTIGTEAWVAKINN